MRLATIRLGEKEKAGIVTGRGGAPHQRGQCRERD